MWIPRQLWVGSFSDFGACSFQVRLTSMNGHRQAASAGPKSADIWVAARWADRLIYLKIVSETRAQPTFGRQRYVQTSGRGSMYRHILIPKDGSELAERGV